MIQAICSNALIDVTHPPDQFDQICSFTVLQVLSPRLTREQASPRYNPYILLFYLASALRIELMIDEVAIPIIITVSLSLTRQKPLSPLEIGTDLGERYPKE
jgi:hypothetical protein